MLLETAAGDIYLCSVAYGSRYGILVVQPCSREAYSELGRRRRQRSGYDPDVGFIICPEHDSAHGGRVCCASPDDFHRDGGPDKLAVLHLPHAVFVHVEGPAAYYVLIILDFIDLLLFLFLGCSEDTGGESGFFQRSVLCFGIYGISQDIVEIALFVHINLVLAS